MRRQWEESVWPMYRRHVEPTARFADVVVDGAAPIAACLTDVLACVRAGESKNPQTGRQLR